LIRDQVNNWLLDGLTYPDIIQRLGEHGKDLKPDHISQWKKRGYHDWLRQREWLEHLTSKSEFSTDILAAPDSSALHEAGLRLAASQMFDQLMRFSASADTTASKGQPEQFSRLVNALSRLTREALAFQNTARPLPKKTPWNSNVSIQTANRPKKNATSSSTSGATFSATTSPNPTLMTVKAQPSLPKS